MTKTKPFVRPTPTGREISVRDDDFIVSHTDKKGIITYANRVFIEFSRYSEEELLGAPHNIVRHPDMPKVVFGLLWETIAAGNEIFAYVKNLAKTGEHYWVYANVTPDYDPVTSEHIGYASVRRKPKESAVREIETLYRKLLEEERRGGMKSSRVFLDELLKQKGVGYDALVRNL